MDKNAGLYNVKRNYRSLHEAKDLYYFQVSLKETDLAIGVDKDSYTSSLLSLCENEVRCLRGELETYISLHPEFRSSFEPLPLLPGAPPLAVIMAQAAYQAGVGPMAAVAGAFAQAVGQKLRTQVRDVIVENGGDIYLDSSTDRLVSVFAGHSKFSYKIAIKVLAAENPLGICTSSGTVGPSLSLGRADAAVILSPSAILADAVATAAGNMVQNSSDVQQAAEFATSIKGVTGAVIIKDDRLAACGKLKLIPLS
jgi:ApbE superfamily uncharacterized protein (UPF0280 family)